MTHTAPNPRGLDPNWPAKRRVTLIGAAVNLVLTVIKIAVGVNARSQALVVDGVHSLSDLFSDAVVLVAARWSAIGADHNHPYGHRRIETVAVAIVGVVLLAVAVGFMVSAASQLFSSEPLPVPGRMALWVAVISVVSKEALFWYTRAVGRRVNYSLVLAKSWAHRSDAPPAPVVIAWHHRSDALSSLVVIAGLIGAQMGFPWLDAVAAIVVAATVSWMGAKFAFQALVELVDTGVSRAEQKALGQIVMSVDGVHGFRRLRTRLMGGQVVMDVCILLDGDLTLNDADRLARRVRRRLLSESTEVFDAVVDVAPWKDRWN